MPGFVHPAQLRGQVQGVAADGNRQHVDIARLESMTPPIQRPVHALSKGTIAAAAVTDAVLILVFAAVGRDAHQRGDVVAGVFLTAWPFLAGAALGWLASKAWRNPLAVRRTGLAVWLGALAGGMVLRLLTNQTVVLPFIIVALLSLGLLLVGWRLVWAGARRLRKN
jgi:peptidoglycan/LPS O-acetylase OafA/YrhL